MIDFQTMDFDDGFCKVKLADMEGIEFQDMPDSEIFVAIIAYDPFGQTMIYVT